MGPSERFHEISQQIDYLVAEWNQSKHRMSYPDGVQFMKDVQGLIQKLQTVKP